MAEPQTRKRVRAAPEARRGQILDEAVRLIGQRGYHGFGIRELAQRCELTDAGLLHYFGSKDRLLVALLEDRDRRDTEAVLSAAGLVEARRSLSLAQVIDLFHATVARNSQQPEIVRLFAVLKAEAVNVDHPAYDFFREREERVHAQFAAVVAPHVPEPRSTALQLIAMMSGLEQEWLRSDQGFDLVSEWDRAAARLLPSPQ